MDLLENIKKKLNFMEQCLKNDFLHFFVTSFCFHCADAFTKNKTFKLKKKSKNLALKAEMSLISQFV